MLWQPHRLIKKVGGKTVLSDIYPRFQKENLLKGTVLIMELHHAIRRRGALGYFASANSADGFYSLYGEAYNEDDYRSLYILKGGPGTGKSTLLDSLASRAESDGYTFEALLCSSDPTSLDGIIIPSIGVAVIDGTPPHAQDPHYPGVCGEIVNLGEMWDSASLKRHRREIEELFSEKSESYARAYRLLSAAGIAGRDVIRAYGRAAEKEKMYSAVKRLLRQLISKSGDGIVVRRFLSAHSICGKVRVNTFEPLAKTTVAVSRSHGFGYIYMNALRELSTESGIRMILIPDALLPEYCETIYYPDDGVLIKIAEDEEYEAGDIRVNCGRFIRSETIRADRAKLRFSEKASVSMTDEALVSLSDSGKTHAKIEEIYKGAMNFDAVSEAEHHLESLIFG